MKQKNILLSVLIFLTFDLMLLGAGVRTLHAGLTCPDWPLCFGKVVPDYHFGVYLEFIHRVIAGFVGLLYLGFFVQMLLKPELKRIKWHAWVGLFLLLAQIVMGGLTVLKLLQASIVTMHLSLATLFLITLVLMKQRLAGVKVKLSGASRWRSIFHILVRSGVFFVFVQIVLGGLVASTYSGLVCVDFPTCNGQWLPTLEGPIGIQVIHRLGAYWLTFLVVILFILALFYGHRMPLFKRQRILAVQIFMLVMSQVYIGVMNLKYLMPPFLSVLHLALALTILLFLLRLNHSLNCEIKESQQI